tara:strand:- start:74 stop:352 length:279 start_codon:yes stop_codon:yes gene_type:complete
MIEEETLTKEEKQELKDNPKSFVVYITKTITEEFVVDADTQEQAEQEGLCKAENFSDPDGSELEDVTVNSSELNTGLYTPDEIDYLEEVLDE